MDEKELKKLVNKILSR